MGSGVVVQAAEPAQCPPPTRNTRQSRQRGKDEGCLRVRAVCRCTDGRRKRREALCLGPGRAAQNPTKEESRQGSFLVSELANSALPLFELRHSRTRVKIWRNHNVPAHAGAGDPTSGHHLIPPQLFRPSSATPRELRPGVCPISPEANPAVPLTWGREGQGLGLFSVTAQNGGLVAYAVL